MWPDCEPGNSRRPLIQRRIGPLTACGVETHVALRRLRVAGQPVEERGKTRGRDADRAVGRPVVDAKRVSVLAEQPAAGEDNLGYVAAPLVRSLGAEDPLVRAREHPLGPLGIEEREAEAVDRAGGRDANAVVE